MLCPRAQGCRKSMLGVGQEVLTRYGRQELCTSPYAVSRGSTLPYTSSSTTPQCIKTWQGIFMSNGMLVCSCYGAVAHKPSPGCVVVCLRLGCTWPPCATSLTI